MITSLQTSSRGGDTNPIVTVVFVIVRKFGGGRSWMSNTYGDRQS